MLTLNRVDAAGSKEALYQQICEQLQELLGDESNFVANAANTAALLFQSLKDVNWVGFYIVEGKDLVLGPFQGNPACARIPFGQGVCGKAASERKTIIVPDVKLFAGHIACDKASQSEIVVPLLNWGKLPKRDKELVILRVGHLRSSEYEVQQHRRLARSRSALSAADRPWRGPPSRICLARHWLRIRV